jgi:hypothetical protein
VKSTYPYTEPLAKYHGVQYIGIIVASLLLQVHLCFINTCCSVYSHVLKIVLPIVVPSYPFQELNKSALHQEAVLPFDSMSHDFKKYESALYMSF